MLQSMSYALKCLSAMRNCLDIYMCVSSIIVTFAWRFAVAPLLLQARLLPSTRLLWFEVTNQAHVLQGSCNTS